MLKLPYIGFLLIVISPLFTQGQTAERNLLATTGQSFQNTSFSMDYSVGEAITSTLVSPNLVLLHGFQQPTGIGELIIEPEKLNMSFYPNPGRDVFHLSIPIVQPSEVTIQVIDVLGQVILSHSGDAGGGDIFQLDMDLGYIATDTYMLRVISGSKVGTQQFVKVTM